MSGPDRLERARQQANFVVASVGVLAILSISSMLVLLWPWQGMEVYSYQATETEVCPLEVVGVVRDYRIHPEANIYSVEVHPSWIAVDVFGFKDGSVLAGPDGRYTEAEEKPGRRVVNSSVLRVAPPQPGEWRLGSTIVVHGSPSILPIPKVQEIELASEEALTVLESDDPKCAEDR